MSAWLDISVDSPDLDAFVDNLVASALEDVVHLLNDAGVADDDPLRARLLGEAAGCVEALIRGRIETARALAVRGAALH